MEKKNILKEPIKVYLVVLSEKGLKYQLFDFNFNRQKNENQLEIRRVKY